MVKKLFFKDPYLVSCDARIVSKEGNKVELDQTVFFAFSGGQASDSGTIGGIPVVDAKKEGNRIIYTLENEPAFNMGDTVYVEIDATKRNKIMRLHSAAHLVYFVFKEKTGIDKMIGSNLDENKARVDYEYSQSLSDMIPELEKAVNEAIASDAPIERIADAVDPERMHWKCKTWECPCGGTHVNQLAEIGALKLKRKNIGGGKERIEIFLSE